MNTELSNDLTPEWAKSLPCANVSGIRESLPVVNYCPPRRECIAERGMRFLSYQFINLHPDGGFTWQANTDDAQRQSELRETIRQLSTRPKYQLPDP